MNEPWQVAELLEDIAKNADPTEVVQRRFKAMLNNASCSPLGFLVNPDEASQTLTITYYIPLETAMKGVDGMPEEVLEWLKTGLTGDQTVAIVNMNGPQFAVTQIHRQAYLLDDMQEMVRSFFTKMKERELEQARRRQQQGR